MIHKILIIRLGKEERVVVSAADSKDAEFVENILRNNPGIDELSKDRSADFAALEIIRTIEFSLGHRVFSVSSHFGDANSQWHVYYRHGK